MEPQQQTDTQPIQETNETVQKPSLVQFLSKFKLLLIVIILIFVSVSGSTYYFLNKKSSPTLTAPSPFPTTAQPSPTLDPTGNWKTYSINGLSVLAPSEWVLAKVSQGYLSIYSPDVPIKERNPSYGRITKGASLLIRALSTDKTIDLAAERLFSECAKAEKKENLIINGYKAQKYDIYCPGRNPGAVSILIERNGIVYVIEFDYTPKPNDSYETIFDQILSTFKFLNQTQMIDISNWKSYSSDCDYKINYPPTWATKKFFIEDAPSSCAYITAPDYKQFQPHGREGFYIQITRVQKGNKLGNQTIHSLDDYIAFQNNATGSFMEVKNKKDRTIGSFIGKEFEPIGAELQTEFIFENGQYVYSVTWPSDYKEEYKSGYKESFNNDLTSVISSIIFK